MYGPRLSRDGLYTRKFLFHFCTLNTNDVVGTQVTVTSDTTGPCRRTSNTGRSGSSPQSTDVEWRKVHVPVTTFTWVNVSKVEKRTFFLQRSL